MRSARPFVCACRACGRGWSRRDETFGGTAVRLFGGSGTIERPNGRTADRPNRRTIEPDMTRST
jgi:hypothetical protein